MIFLRPIVVRDPSLDGDLAEYRRYLPGRDFFPDERLMGPKFDESVERMRREFPSSIDPTATQTAPVPEPAGGRP